MDWEKVIKALDDEWDRRKRRADGIINEAERQRMLLTADIAFMLRDCLQIGLKD